MRSRVQSLERRFTLMNLLVSATALLIALASFFAYDLVSYKNNVVRALATQARIIGANSVAALMFDDPASATQTLSALQASPYVIEGAIVRNDGTVFATYHKGAGKTLSIPSLRSDERQRYWFEGLKLYTLQAIELEGKRQGTVYIEYNAEQVLGRMARFLVLALFLVIGSLAAGMLVARAFRRSVVSPISALSDAALEVSRRRDYSRRVSAEGAGPEVRSLINAFNNMLAQIQERDSALETARNELEKRVEDRTKQLVAINRELEAFSYSVSHDLRGPLDVINGFAHILKTEADAKLSANEQECIEQIRGASARMSELIEDLLNLSRVSATAIHVEQVDLSTMARNIAEQLQLSDSQRDVEFVIADCPPVLGDARLLQIVLENLFRNAWKYTSHHARARIEFGCKSGAYYVRDDGAGFDPEKAVRLFKPFQRLHTKSEFPGTGIGLATVQRVIHRHGGEIWASGGVETGATFYFRLGNLSGTPLGASDTQVSNVSS